MTNYQQQMDNEGESLACAVIFAIILVATLLVVAFLSLMGAR